MYSKVYSFLAIAFIALSNSCGTKFPGYEKLERDAYIKVLNIGDGEFSPSVGQHISYQLRIFNESKTEIYSTNKKGVDKYEHLFYTHNKSGVFQRNLPKFHKGDSLSFMMSNDLLIEQFPQMKTISDSKYFQVDLKIIHIENETDRKNRLDGLSNYAKLNEDIVIEEYFSSSENADDFVKWNGLFIKTLKNASQRVKKNDHLILKYKAYFLTGELIDETTDSTFIKYSFGESAQVIEGLSLVISKTGVGSEVEVIIPSKLAFGDDGSSSGIVPPNTPLRYELEILEDTTIEKY